MVRRAPEVSEFDLERLQLGELPAERLRELRDQLAPAQFEQHRQRLAQSDATLRQQLPPAAEFAREVARRRGDRAGGSRAALWAFPALAAAAALLLVLPRAEVDTPPEPTPTERLKGALSPSLRVYRKQGEQAEALQAGSTARSGDVLQLSYVARNRAYGAIVSIDGAGAVTLHSPATEHGSALLEPEGATLLPDAYELDDAPGFERFFFVTSRRRVSVGEVLRAARALAGQPERAAAQPLSLSAGLEQTSFLLRKESP